MAAIVDWRTIQEGSPMSDLARFLVNCCDGSIRRQAEEMAFDYYYECLTKEFGNDASKVPYTVEHLKKAYNYHYLTQCFFIIGVMTFMHAHIKEK